MHVLLSEVTMKLQSHRDFNVFFYHHMTTLSREAHLCSLEVLLDKVERKNTRLFRLLEVLAKHRLHRLGRFHDVVVGHLLVDNSKGPTKSSLIYSTQVTACIAKIAQTTLFGMCLFASWSSVQVIIRGEASAT